MPTSTQHCQCLVLSIFCYSPEETADSQQNQIRQHQVCIPYRADCYTVCQANVCYFTAASKGKSKYHIQSCHSHIVLAHLTSRSLAPYSIPQQGSQNVAFHALGCFAQAHLYLTMFLVSVCWNLNSLTSGLLL